MVFCENNGDGFIQYPDSTHIFVKSNISTKEWDLHQLSLWMQTMGVNKESSFQISNLSQNTIEKTAEKLKHDLIEIRFELKNDYKMPTIIVDKKNKNTNIIFHNEFNVIFSHSTNNDNCISIINHIDIGKFEILNDNDQSYVNFIPNATNNANSEKYKVDLNDENPSISFNDNMSISLNGEYKTIDDDDDNAENDGMIIDPRLFVVYRDGNGFELLSNDNVEKFREYLINYQPKPQIFEPKPLLTTTTNESPLSHKFVIEKFVRNPPRKELNIPSVLGNTLNSKLMSYENNDNNKINQSCHIYRHLLQTQKITSQDIVIAQNDILNFENWLKENDNNDKLENNKELNEINNQLIEQRNKLKQENNLSPLELKLTLTTELELERSKLNELNNALQKEQEKLENEEKEQQETSEEIENKENEMKGREIRKMQRENIEKAASEKENSSYFDNEPFLRDYEINQNLLEIFAYFIKIWNDYKDDQEVIDSNHNEEIDKLFAETLSLLKILCKRLREIISIKTIKGNLKVLSLNEEFMINIIKNQFITQNIHNLLCSIGFKLIESKSNKLEFNGYIPQQSNIFIDAGICYILSKLDEYHSKHKKYLFKVNGNSIDCVKTFEMDLKTKIIHDIGDNDIDIDIVNDNNHIERKKKNNNYDTPYLAQSPSYSVVTDYEQQPDLNRNLSHCTCCPPDSPQRATKMDYLGRNRGHIISMDDLENYPKKVKDKQLNYKYIETEGCVQRRVRTSSTFNTSLNFADNFPTIIIQPNMIDFGIIKLNYVYRFTATITNHGNNQARFKIDITNHNKNDIFIKPYYRTGGIAPGITIMLEIEFCSTKFIGKYQTKLCIKTQKYVFNMNLKAEITKDIDDPIIDYNPTIDTNAGKKSRVSCLGKKQ